MKTSSCKFHSILTLAACTTILSTFAEPILVPNAGFEERETFDPFPEGTDKYNQWSRESWRHFDIAANGGPLRIWNPGAPGLNETAQGIADVAFGGTAPEGNYMVVVRSRENDPARTFEAATQLLAETFDSSKAYTLTAKVGRLPETENGGSSNYDPDWFGYSLQFVVGGTTVDGATFAGQVTGGTILAEDLNSQVVPENEFVTASVIYFPNPADAQYDGLPIQIRLCALETPVNPEDDSLAGWVAFDDVTLETGVARQPRIPFSVSENSANLDLAWESKEGMFYVLRTSTDLTADLSTWDSVNVPGSVDNGGVFEIATNPPLNRHTIPRPGDPERYYRVQELALPPPPPLLEENFDAVIGPGLPSGWSSTAGASAWEVGDPFGGALSGPPAASSGLNCAGTVINADYLPATDYSLISPAIAIPAGGATLRFRQFIDTDEQGDVGTIRILDADNGDALIEVLDPPGNIEGISAGWSAESIPLPAAANGANIKIEFHLTSNDNSFEFAGFYVDDVTIVEN